MEELKGEVVTVNCLTFTRTLPGTIDRAWAHLTDTSLLPAWFGDDARIEPRQGGGVWLMDGHVRGTVTQWQPPNRLVYTWNVFEPADPQDAVSEYPESYLTFDLEARGSDVLLTFRHFPIPGPFLARSGMGWHVMLELLRAALLGTQTEARSTLMKKYAGLYGVDLDELAR